MTYQRAAVSQNRAKNLSQLSSSLLWISLKCSKENVLCCGNILDPVSLRCWTAGGRTRWERRLPVVWVRSIAIQLDLDSWIHQASRASQKKTNWVRTDSWRTIWVIKTMNVVWLMMITVMGKWLVLKIWKVWTQFSHRMRLPFSRQAKLNWMTKQPDWNLLSQVPQVLFLGTRGSSNKQLRRWCLIW